jgi:FAD/FMN-containing dehydrogenase
MSLSPATPDFVKSLGLQLAPDTLREPEARHLAEPRGRWTGQGAVVAMPRNVEQVATVVRACARARVGIVPWGGGTGLVGGQVMTDGPLPLILSLERMNTIRETYPAENVMVAEAGCILDQVHQAAKALDRLFPLTLASQGTCTIGGNLAANAGGVNVLRYGNARELCLGLEAVMADGTIWHGLRRLRKDNAGYAIRDLIIGSEGTLGIITAASLRLFPQPASTGAALMVVPDPQAALTLLGLAQSRLGGLISAFELISGVGLAFLSETMPQVRQPFASQPPWMVLIDLGCPAGIDPAAALEALAAEAMAKGLVLDGTIAQSESQRTDFWTLRENIPLANRAIGAISSHDIALPLSEIPGFIKAAAPGLACIGTFRINCFGHLGDGNLHYNVFPPKGGSRADFDHQRAAIKTCVHDLVAQLDGSVAAEHGVGRLKTGDLDRYADPAKLAAMRAIKSALDPQGILNPGAVLS